MSKQSHRYIFPVDLSGGITDKGHITTTGATVTMCGIENKKLGRTTRRKKFPPETDLCLNCLAVLKEKLKEKYNLPEW